jgi:hypothetical protein
MTRARGTQTRGKLLVAMAFCEDQYASVRGSDGIIMAVSSFSQFVLHPIRICEAQRCSSA